MFYGISEELIREYARLIVRTGINVQPGQELIVNCPVEHYEFAHLVIEEAYAAGAGEVVMRWNDTLDVKEYYKHASDERLAEVPDWKVASAMYYSKRGAASVSIAGDDPEGLKGVDPHKMHLRSAAMDKAMEEHNRLLMASSLPWSVAAVPQKKWAKKVFPELSEYDAMNALWKMILKAVRIGEGDAVIKWQEHDEFLKNRCKKLTAYGFEKLHYKNSIGTDFTVGLVKGHKWVGGSDTSGCGIIFEPNMPTEEIFTMPDYRVAEGTLVSSLPLSYRGNLIKNFSLTFHEGQVVSYDAEEGLETLKSIIDGDEGSKRLGEVAIVPYSSPISQMNTLFYNTLFDENASCHFALGKCYPMTMEGGTKMSKEELTAMGGNFSMNHVDFMIGTADLTITGIKEDGTEILLVENGDWVKE